MNKTHNITLFLLAIISALSSCTKNTDNSNHMTALINNMHWTATTIHYKDTTHSGLREVLITGADSSSLITIDMVRYNGPAFYNSGVSSAQPYAITAYIKNNITHYTDTAQVAVNTTTNNTIKGTFFITTTDTIHITEGSFDIHM